jgi:hypothetical protein
MNDTTFIVVAIVAALTLFGVVAITIVSITLQQQAEAAQPPGKGCEFARGGNASQGRCIH